MNFQSRTTESSNDKLVLLIFLTDCSVSQSVSHGTDGKVGHQSGGWLFPGEEGETSASRNDTVGSLAKRNPRRIK